MRRSEILFSIVILLSAAVAMPQCITTYDIPDGYYGGIPRSGPDGALWFAMVKAENNGGTILTRIGRVDTAGNITSYPVPGVAQIEDLAFDSNGNLWYTDVHNSSVVRFSPSVGILQQVQTTQGGYPNRIVRGPDNNLWFTEQSAGKIARLTTSGDLTEFTIPNADNPVGITAGPDGNLWFASRGGIGRVTTAGAITMFPANNFPYMIAAGPDGNLWFTQRTGPKVVRITTAGVATEFTVPNASILAGITAGSDGRIWFTDEGALRIGNVTIQGMVSILPVVVYGPSPGISAGPNSTLWVPGGSNAGFEVLNKLELTPTLGPPALLSVQPNFGPTVGGTVVEIQGNNFQQKATVSFGGASASPVVFATPQMLTATTPTHPAGFVDVVITNCDGATATLSNAFSFDCQAPTISQQPQGSTLKSGESVTLHVGATGTTPLAYQWFAGNSGDDSSRVANGTLDALTVTPPGTASYWVRVTNTCGAASSVTAVVTVCQPPVLTQQPASQTLVRGEPVTLTVTLTGTLPFSFQWYEGLTGDASRPVSGATTQTFTSEPLTANTSFWVRVSNDCGAVQSGTATVMVSTSTKRRAVHH